MGYFVGVDIGGTFTDCVVLGDDGSVTQSKASTTPENLTRGFLRAIEIGGEQLDLSLRQLLEETELLLHGTTVATNLLVQMAGATTGLITTRGHRDALIMMRSAGRSMGLPIEKLLHVSRQFKPDPIISPAHIKEVTERMDWAGDVIAPLQKEDVRRAAEELSRSGIEAVAISFLWGFVNPSHELIAKEIVQEIIPNGFVTCAHELAKKPGEYERSAATAINAYIGPRSSSYIRNLAASVKENGYRNPLLIMQASGGLATASDVESTPLFTIGSGPVAGVVACAATARRKKHLQVIATDMGGTSFDVGILDNGVPLTDKIAVINQYSFFMPRLRVESIGAGGGSLVWIDKTSKTMRVGPESAQADPGPACYGRGGRAPTVTDANVVLGFYKEGAELSDGLRLEKDLAMEALESVAKPLGLSPEEAAAGAIRIVDNQMAGLMRQLTLEQGKDPREFSVYCFGGAAGLHASGYTRSLGSRQFMVPRGNLASGFSALGVAESDRLHVFEHAELVRAPFPAIKVNQIFKSLESQAVKQFAREGIGSEAISISRSLDMKFSLQIHEVEVASPEGTLDSDDLAEQERRFVESYEQIYGKGSAFPSAGSEIGVFRIRARSISYVPSSEGPLVAMNHSVINERMVYWTEYKDTRKTGVYDGTQIVSGFSCIGPSIVEYPSTMVAIRPGDKCELDEFGNLVVQVGGA